MKTYINYLTNLLDFVVLQRTSFCWFVSEGISEELKWFSHIYSFKKRIQYILFGEEYILIKPPNPSAIVRKLEGDYQTQLIIPMETRYLEEKKIISERNFLILNLPLMSIYSTFILNGCERVVISQIVRSPGIYFEKQSVSKKFPYFKRKLSTEIGKLRSFLPSGEAVISDSDLFFAKKEVVVRPKHMNKKKTLKENLLNRKFCWTPLWDTIPMRSFSITFLKKKEKYLDLFTYIFKFYQIVLKEINFFQKQKLILFIIKWMHKIIPRETYILNSLSINFLLDFFKLLLRFIFKYNLIIKKNKMNLPNFNKRYILELKRIQKLIHVELNQKLILIFSKWIQKQSIISTNLHFLKDNFKNSAKSLKNQKILIKSNNLKPIVYFSKTLKDQLKYFFSDLFSNYEFYSKQHKYLKSKAQFLLFNEDHKIKTLYHSKYQSNEKELYRATLIPEYGSWIHFKFQKQNKTNSYSYPIRYEREDLVIQFDRINSTWILFFLKEIGFDDISIYHNLEHSDFFYSLSPIFSHENKLNKPSLLFNFYPASISKFSQIFHPFYYRLGKMGRLQLNQKLNLKISQRLQTITYEDLFAIIDKLITLTISISLKDDIDHLKNRRVRSNGELLQNLFRIGFQRLERKFFNKTQFDVNILDTVIREFFGSSQLSQYLDQTNPLSSLTHRRRISGLGPGGLDSERISFAIRDIHPSHYGRICPIETPEGKNVGLVSSLTTCARVNQFGFLETPFWRVINGKILKIGKPIYLAADIEDLYKIAPSDVAINKSNYIIQHSIPTRYRQDFLSVAPFEIDFISISHVQIVSIATALIPFFEHDDANRALMGANMQRQSVPLLLPQKPIVGTGFENQIAIDSGMSVNAENSGIIEKVDANQIIMRIKNGEKICYTLQKYMRSNQQTCINHRPIVWVGETIKSGQMLTDGPSLSMNELALGQNILVSYMPWQGYNFEDAILISEKLIYDNIFSSIHIERYKIQFDELSETYQEITKDIPSLDFSQLKNLNDDGIIKVGTYVRPGEILVGKIIENKEPKQLPESKLLRAIFGVKLDAVKDNSYRMPNGRHGRVVESIIFTTKTTKFEKMYIFIAELKRIQVGDKIAGRHGNKGIISRILSRQDMPFLPDGTPVDMVLNPLGVPSRMNVGQIYECLLGLVGQKLNCRFKILPFDESYGMDVSRILINKKLRQVSLFKNESWLYNPYAPGKMVLIDGRTGKEFENPITVGTAYMLKLIHLVDDKMHARAVGPYSLITQQPLRGKSQQGGQRFGEMEVWALEGFGAAFTLKELLTIKSDDVEGRNDLVIAIVAGENLPNLGVPESFKVLLQELRSIGLDIKTYAVEKFSYNKNYLKEINLIETYDTNEKYFDPDSKINIKNIKF